MTKENLLVFGEQKLQELHETERVIKGLVTDALKEIGHPVCFDWEASDAPCYASTLFQDDLTDVFVTKIWLENGFVYANLHAYYLGEDVNNVLLSDDSADYCDILEFLLDELK